MMRLGSMRVVTLNDKEFGLKCESLAKMVMADSTDWLAIIGIATGGVYVAKALGRMMDAPVYTVKLQRPSTGYKKGLLKKIFRVLPRKLNDCLRMMESVLLSAFGGKHADDSNKRADRVEIPEECLKFLLKCGSGRVLLADDAVDSGLTMKGVLEALGTLAPEVDFVPAVITVTTDHPAVEVKYMVYGNRTLVRFPWSIDAQ